MRGVSTRGASLFVELELSIEQGARSMLEQVNVESNTALLLWIYSIIGVVV